jgi:hypothetical protein
MKKSNWKRIYLTAFIVSLSACAGAPPISPHFLDTQAKEMREYQVVDANKMTFDYKQSHPMQWGKDTYGNGFVCIPPEQFAEWREYYLKNKSQGN